MSADDRRRRRLALLGLGLGLSAPVVAVSLAVGPLGVRPASSPSKAPEGKPDQLRGHVLPAELAGSRAFRLDLPDARGGRITSSDLDGHPYALTFLFTSCTDVCPVIGQDLKAVLERLGGRSDDVSVIAVSVDPRRDTPAAARRWLRLQRAPENFRYAVGTTEQLKPAWRAYYAAPEIKRPPAMSTHSASVWLIDERGRVRTRYSAGRPLPIGDVASDLRTLLAEDDS